MDFVGKTVKKQFQGLGVLSGIVNSYDPSTGFLKILYENGDSEELELSVVALVFHRAGLGMGAGAKAVINDQSAAGASKFEFANEPLVCQKPNKWSHHLSDSGNKTFAKFSSENCLTESGKDIILGQYGPSQKGLLEDYVPAMGNLSSGERSSGLDLNVGLNLTRGLNLNEGFNINVDSEDHSEKNACIDLNLDVNGEFDEKLKEGDLGNHLVETQKKKCCFDLNMELNEGGKNSDSGANGEFGGKNSDSGANGEFGGKNSYSGANGEFEPKLKEGDLWNPGMETRKKKFHFDLNVALDEESKNLDSDVNGDLEDNLKEGDLGNPGVECLKRMGCFDLNMELDEEGNNPDSNCEETQKQGANGGVEQPLVVGDARNDDQACFGLLVGTQVEAAGRHVESVVGDSCGGMTKETRKGDDVSGGFKGGGALATNVIDSIPSQVQQKKELSELDSEIVCKERNRIKRSKASENISSVKEAMPRRRSQRLAMASSNVGLQEAAEKQKEKGVSGGPEGGASTGATVHTSVISSDLQLKEGFTCTGIGTGASEDGSCQFNSRTTCNERHRKKRKKLSNAAVETMLRRSSRIAAFLNPQNNISR